MSLVQESVNILGRYARDKITGIFGPITSVSFDLNGCVQCIINRGLDKDGKPYEGYWMDIQRMDLEPSDPIMPLPTQYQETAPERPHTYAHGAIEGKPIPR